MITGNYPHWSIYDDHKKKFVALDVEGNFYDCLLGIGQQIKQKGTEMKPLIENLAIYKLLEQGKIELFAVEYIPNGQRYTFAADKTLNVKIGDFVTVGSTSANYPAIVKVVDVGKININLSAKYRFINFVIGNRLEKSAILEEHNKIIEDLNNEIEVNKAKKAFADLGLTL